MPHGPNAPQVYNVYNISCRHINNHNTRHRLQTRRQPARYIGCRHINNQHETSVADTSTITIRYIGCRHVDDQDREGSPAGVPLLSRRHRRSSSSTSLPSQQPVRMQGRVVTPGVGWLRCQGRVCDSHRGSVGCGVGSIHASGSRDSATGVVRPCVQNLRGRMCGACSFCRHGQGRCRSTGPAHQQSSMWARNKLARPTSSLRRACSGVRDNTHQVTTDAHLETRRGNHIHVSSHLEACSGGGSGGACQAVPRHAS